MCSGLLLYRIWAFERNVSTTRSPKSIRLPIVDDAFAFCGVVSIVIFFVHWSWSKSISQHTVLDLVSLPFTPVVENDQLAAHFSLLLHDAQSHYGHLLTVCTRRTANETERPLSRQSPMEPLRVHISQFTHGDNASTYETGNKDAPAVYKADCVEGGILRCRNFPSV